MVTIHVFMRVCPVNNEKTKGQFSHLLNRIRMVKPGLLLHEVLAPI